MPKFLLTMGERRLKPSQLVTAVEIAERLNLSHPENVHTWRRRHADFPQPVVKLGDTNRPTLVWAWPDVLAWAKSTGRWPPKADH